MVLFSGGGSRRRRRSATTIFRLHTDNNVLKKINTQKEKRVQFYA